MKKIIYLLTLFILSLFSLPSWADIIPSSTKSIQFYGVGTLNMPNNYTVYEFPDKNSKVIREVNYEKIKKSAITNSLDMRKVSYIAHVPANNVALLTVEMNADNNWYNVYLNQKTGETGWVYNEDPDAFCTYRGLFYKYGKKYGLKMYSDLPSEKKVLYSSVSTNSQVLEELTYPKHITFTLIRGNWMLVAVNDMTKQAKVGWFNWRNDDGTLNLFPNFKD